MAKLSSPKPSGARPGRAPQNGARHSGLGETMQDLRDLLVAYARQETVDPLKTLGRYLGWGIPGSLLLALGAFLVGLGIQRGLQHLDWFQHRGWGSLAPYAGAIAFIIVIMAVCGRKMKNAMAASRAGSGAPR